MTTFYDFSGGMESAAMLVIERDRIRQTGAIVRWADTGKQFPEMAASIAQIEAALGLKIVTVPRRITFDEFLFEKGGMIRKGTTDCSRRMKRSNLVRHAKTFEKPWEINIGFNAAEVERADAFYDRNERQFCHWRFPLIEHCIGRPQTVRICQDAGFSILCEVYRRMGRFDCFMCGNQTPSQALRVVDEYPDLAAQWMAMEDKKGHSFMPVPLRILVEASKRPGGQGCLDFGLTQCACFGGTEDFFDDEVEVDRMNQCQACGCVKGVIAGAEYLTDPEFCAACLDLWLANNGDDGITERTRLLLGGKINWPKE